VTYPVFMFICSAEAEADGYLFLNTFGRRWPTRRQRIEIEEIIRGVRADAEAGLLGEVKVGWGGDGVEPLTAVDTSDAAVMAGWFARAYVVDVKLDRSDEAAIAATVDEDVAERRGEV
jgi:hypothetical protein